LFDISDQNTKMAENTSSSESDFEDFIVERRLPLFRPHVEWDIFSPGVFRENFRCTKAQAEVLLTHIGPDIAPKAFTNHAVTAKERLLIAMRFYGDSDDYHAGAASERRL
jgi:hypothetical protein